MVESELGAIVEICSAEQMSTDAVSRIVEFDVVQVEFVAGEVHDHAADGDFFRHTEIGQIAAQKIRAS